MQAMHAARRVHQSGSEFAMHQVHTLNASTTASRFDTSAEKSMPCPSLLPNHAPLSQSGSPNHESNNVFNKPVCDRPELLRLGGWTGRQRTWYNTSAAASMNIYARIRKLILFVEGGVEALQLD